MRNDNDSLNIWPVWLNGWVFVYELRGCGFESRCSHLDVGNDKKPILNYINKFKNHPGIKVKKSRKKEEQTFTFNYVSYEEYLNEIRKLKTAIQQNDIPTKILKEKLGSHFHENISFCIEDSIFPSDLKIANVTPAFKKKSKASKDNYRPQVFYKNFSYHI